MNTITITFSPTVSLSGNCMILDQLIRNILSQKTFVRKINLIELTNNLNQLNDRMTKALMDIIVNYNASNPQLFTIMGRSNSAPYNGSYDKTSNNTSFDLSKFPESLIVILDEFNVLNSKNRK